MNTAFDTLQYAKRAEEAGFTKQQAEFQAKEISKLIRMDIANKEDVNNLRGDIKTLRQELLNMKNELLIKLGGFIVVWTTIALTVLGFIIKT